jgi:hypothetical protein
LKLHAPFTQVAVAFPGAVVQAWLSVAVVHPPQLETSVVTLMQAFPQGVYPVLQVGVQVPFEQVAVAFASEVVQAWLAVLVVHPPQLARSLAVSTQLPLQFTREPQFGTQLPALHVGVVPEQTWPEQPPQWLGSVWGSMQASPHLTRFASHSQPHWPAAQVGWLPAGPLAGQGWPHCPQLFGSVSVSTHAPVQQEGVDPEQAGLEPHRQVPLQLSAAVGEQVPHDPDPLPQWLIFKEGFAWAGLQVPMVPPDEQRTLFCMQLPPESAKKQSTSCPSFTHMCTVRVRVAVVLWPLASVTTAWKGRPGSTVAVGRPERRPVDASSCIHPSSAGTSFSWNVSAPCPPDT